MSLKPASFFTSYRRNLLRIFMLLAASKKPLGGRKIAKELDISVQSVRWCLKAVEAKEFIRAARGGGEEGGYTLTTDPKDITVLDILGATILPEEEPYGLYVLMRRMVDAYDDITLQDLLDWNE